MPKRVIIEKVGILLKIEQHLRKSINQNISSNTLDAHFNKAMSWHSSPTNLINLVSTFLGLYHKNNITFRHKLNTFSA